MTDDELLATCIADEAAAEPYEGKVAVGIVLLNRMALRYESDGTAVGTVLKHFQFSGFWFSMVEGHYKQTQFDQAHAEAEAERLFTKFSTQPVWADCVRALADARAWRASQALSFIPGPAFKGLTSRTVLYLNPAISHTSWATPEKRDAIIFHHEFFHA